LTQPGELARAFAAAGLEQVTEASLTIRMDFSNFDDYWQPLIHGQGTLGTGHACGVPVDASSDDH